MKIAIIGGASVRTPLLVRGLAGSDLPIAEIGLYDVDQQRLATIARIARSYAPNARAYDDARACVSDAAFVVLSIRAGGIEARARDEATAIAHGIVGQETVGPGGFAMAMRTAPHAVAYARLIAHVAPRAWVINFTNPVGIITQAMTTATEARVIGICDTPTELFEDVARALDLSVERCLFDYFGLNHLGWLREVYCDGDPQLGRLWDAPERLSRIYRGPLFTASFLRNLRLLPTEYLYFYYSPALALENTRRAGETRGEAIAKLNTGLFEDLTAPDADYGAIYDAYLDARNAGYMQIESGSARSATAASARTESSSATASAERATSWSAKASAERNLIGYDRIALGVIRAIHFNSNDIIPVNVPNRGSIPVLADEDIVEVPCVLNANGARPLSVGSLPEAARDLLLRVKTYERLTVAAAAGGSTADAVRALAANPLVGSPALAASLVGALQPW